MPNQVTETGTQQAGYQLNSDDVLDTLSTNPQGLSDEEAEARLAGARASPCMGNCPEAVQKPAHLCLAPGLDRHGGDAALVGCDRHCDRLGGQRHHWLFSRIPRRKCHSRADEHGIAQSQSAPRWGPIEEVDSAEIVPGDIVVVNEGDVVPADLRIIESSGLQTNGAALTGESVPVSKTHEAMEGAEESLPPADQENMAFMGTAVTAGRGEGVVMGTGEQTQIGSIAQNVRASGTEKTPLQQRTDRLAKWIAGLLLVIIVISFAIGLLKGRSLQEMFLLSVSLAVSAMPAGLPVVITVALAVGVRRMAKRHVIMTGLGMANRDDRLPCPRLISPRQ